MDKIRLEAFLNKCLKKSLVEKIIYSGIFTIEFVNYDLNNEGETFFLDIASYCDTAEVDLSKINPKQGVFNCFKSLSVFLGAELVKLEVSDKYDLILFFDTQKLKIYSEFLRNDEMLYDLAWEFYNLKKDVKISALSDSEIELKGVIP